MKRICLCMFTAVTLIIIFILNSSFSIEVEYSSEQSGAMQVFYSQSKDIPFTAQNSIKKDLTQGGKTSLYFNVPIDCVNSLRFDIDGVDKISIYSISMRCGLFSEQSFNAQQLSELLKPGTYAKISLQDGKLVYTANGADPTAVITSFSSKDHMGFLVIVPLAFGLGAALLLYIILRMMKIQTNFKPYSPNLRRLRPVAFITLCALCITIPSFSYAFENNNSEFENRTLATKPELTVSGINNYPEEYEAYLEDNMALKPAIVKSYSQSMYYTLHSSIVRDVIVGQDDWLFYNPETINCNTIGTYLDTFDLDEQSVCSTISAMSDFCADRGIEFYVMLCPNKEEIYDEYLPSYIANIQKESPCDRVADTLKDKGVNVIYPYDELKARRDDHLLYMKQDTHWNVKGAYIAYRQFYKAYAGDELPDIDDIEFTEKQCYQDLAKMLHLENTGVDYDADISYTTEGAYSLNLTLTTSNTAANGKSIMFIGDSFSRYLTNFIAKDFTNASFTWKSTYFPTDKIETAKPDVVIMELVERRLSDFKLEHFIDNSVLMSYIK